MLLSLTKWMWNFEVVCNIFSLCLTSLIYVHHTIKKYIRYLYNITWYLHTYLNIFSPKILIHFSDFTCKLSFRFRVSVSVSCFILPHIPVELLVTFFSFKIILPNDLYSVFSSEIPQASTTGLYNLCISVD